MAKFIKQERLAILIGIIACLFFEGVEPAMVPGVDAYNWIDEDGVGNQVSNRQQKDETFGRDKMGAMKDFCGRFDDWCSMSIEHPVLKCCPGYVCKCSVWGSNCKCRKNFFG